MSFLKQVSLISGLLLSAAATGQSLDNRWQFQVGAYFPRVNSEFRVDGSGGNIGTGIDFEDDLGFERSNILPAFMVEWRPGDDWTVNAEYYGLGRSSTTTLKRDISVGDTVFPVNASVRAGFDSDIARLTIGNRLFQKPNLEIGAALGLHATNFSLFVEGEGSVGEQSASFRSETRTLFAPLPTIGLFLTARPAPKMHVNARFDWLSLTIDDYDGRLINTVVAGAYSVHRNVDIGIMYRLVDYRVRVRRERWNGEVAYQFAGPSVFLQLGF